MSFEISVIITVYNRDKVVERAINSVLMQKDCNFEIVIVDDGSEDNSLELLSKFKILDNVSIYRKDNGGAASAKNYGVAKAKAKYVVFLDSDDEFYHDKVLFHILSSHINDFKFVCHGQILFTEVDKHNYKSSDFSRNDFKKFIYNSPLNYPGFPPYSFEKTDYINAGGMSELYNWGDAMLFWREYFSSLNSIDVIDDVAYVYHLEGDDRVGNAANSNKRKLSNMYHCITDVFMKEKCNMNYFQRSNWIFIIAFLSIKIGKVEMKFIYDLLLSIPMLPLSALYLIKTKLL